MSVEHCKAGIPNLGSRYQYDFDSNGVIVTATTNCGSPSISEREVKDGHLKSRFYYNVLKTRFVLQGDEHFKAYFEPKIQGKGSSGLVRMFTNS